MKYSNVAPYRIYQRHSAETKYDDEKEDDVEEQEEVRLPSHKQQIYKDKVTSLQVWHKEEGAKFPSHPGKSLTLAVY